VNRGMDLLFFFNLGDRCGLVICVTPRLLPPERPGTHCVGGWVSPRAGLEGCEKSRPHRDPIPDGPARSESLYRLSYPGPQLTVNKLINFHSAVEVLWLILVSKCCIGSEFSLFSSDYPLFINYARTAYFFILF
jgi:hypothetical protein